jgi:hypothetical protein
MPELTREKMQRRLDETERDIKDRKSYRGPVVLYPNGVDPELQALRFRRVRIQGWIAGYYEARAQTMESIKQVFGDD